MVRISGFGQTGPYRHRPGFGAIGEAMGGLRYTTGAPDRPPSRAGISIGDSLASLHAVIGALMSLIAIKDGLARGQIVDVSLVESVFNVMESLVPEYDFFGEVRERSGGKLPGIAPSNTYASRDKRWIVIAGNSDSIFRRLMSVIGRPDLGDDASLATNDGRVARETMIDDAIAAWTVKQSADDILSMLESAQIPCSRIYSAADIVRDPHLIARDISIRIARRQKGRDARHYPEALRNTREHGLEGPALGAHTNEVLAALGYEPTKIASLRQEGII